MGRIVWFTPPLLASGFGAPAAVVIGTAVGTAVVVGSLAYFFTKK